MFFEKKCNFYILYMFETWKTKTMTPERVHSQYVENVAVAWVWEPFRRTHANREQNHANKRGKGQMQFLALKLVGTKQNVTLLGFLTNSILCTND